MSDMSADKTQYHPRERNSAPVTPGGYPEFIEAERRPASSPDLDAVNNRGRLRSW